MMIRDITKITLRQLSDILDQISDDDYGRKLEILGGSSFGQHVRHVIEFYQCLFSEMNNGTVNYDRRCRNLQLETEVAYAGNSISEIISELNSYEKHKVNMIHHIIEYGGQVSEVTSSLERELIYLIEHSIHHFAIMNIALRHDFKGIVIPENFGVAYSTIKHKKEEQSLVLEAAH
jgi:uncharacterized damage-inducible protein DinB